jgi:hypothetical protein
MPLGRLWINTICSLSAEEEVVLLLLLVLLVVLENN